MRQEREKCHLCRGKFYKYLISLARYACEPELDANEFEAEPDDDDESEPAGDGGPTFNIPLTMYFDSFASFSLDERLFVSCSNVFESLSPRFGSGVDSRAFRLVRRRSEDEFSIFFSFLLCLLYA